MQVNNIRYNPFLPLNPSKPKTKETTIPLSHLGLAFGTDPDYDRFQKIVKGKAREDLKRFISPDKMNIVKGGKIVQLPMPRIVLPKFTRGTQDEGGVGSGKGEEGDKIGKVGKDGEPTSADKAGENAGEHNQEQWGPEITRSEIARLLIEDVKLPNLEPKGTDNVKETDIKWTNISSKGSKINLRATLENAIKRSILEQGEDLKEEDIHIEPKDIRYHTWQVEEKPKANAVIIYAMDVSGSMGEEQKQIARTANFYLSTIIQHQYGELNAKLKDETFTDDRFGEGVEEVFVIHDSDAREVTEKEFYTTTESGGTKISSAYKLIQKLIKEKYDPQNWNIYIFHYSDGDNWGDDTPESLKIIEELLPIVNEVGYIQMKSSWGSGEFKNSIEKQFGSMHNKVRTSLIAKSSSDEFRQVIQNMLSERKEEQKK